ncbi:MAG: hypothetical protein WC881_12280 [Elusimicrobiota bacterium]|jgi:hypothetical protein
MKTTLTEMLVAVGDENLKFQRLAATLVGGENPSKGATGRLTVAVEKPLVSQALRQMVTGRPAEQVGLLVWIPRDKLPAGLREL